MFDQLILYEELIRDPETILNELFKIMELSPEHIPVALEALEHDSQQGMKFGERGAIEAFAIKDGNKVTIDKIYKDFQVPISCFMSDEEFCAGFPRPTNCK